MRKFGLLLVMFFLAGDLCAINSMKASKNAGNKQRRVTKSEQGMRGIAHTGKLQVQDVFLSNMQELRGFISESEKRTQQGGCLLVLSWELLLVIQ